MFAFRKTRLLFIPSALIAVMTIAAGCQTGMPLPGAGGTDAATSGTDPGTGGTNSGPTSTVPPPPSVTPMLYVANVNAGVVAFANPATAKGDIAPALDLSGATTRLSFSTAVAIDKAGGLVVSGLSGNSLQFFDNAATATGNISPNRTIMGNAMQSLSTRSIAMDRANDLLFVASGNNSVIVFEKASTATGNVSPVRQIISSDIAAPYGLALAANGDLYVANSVGRSVSVFAHAATRDGTIPADRVITSTAFAANTAPVDVFVTADDHLFVLDVSNREVFIFSSASTQNTNATPSSILTVDVAGSSLYGIVVDSKGTGYISDSTGFAIHAFDSIATRNGTFTPDRTIQGIHTQLDAPLQMFLVE